jgi:hypothetical protein
MYPKFLKQEEQKYLLSSVLCVTPGVVLRVLMCPTIHPEQLHTQEGPWKAPWSSTV